MGWGLRLAALCVASGLALVGAAARAEAATINVACSAEALVSAVTAANATAVSDTVSLAPSCLYSLLSTMAVAPTGSSGLVVSQPLTIEGNGARIERSATAPQFRVFFVANTQLTLRDLTIERGSLTTGSGAGLAGSFADVDLDGVTVSGNVTTASNALGGGILVSGGSLAVHRSTIVSNQAPNGAAIATQNASSTISQSVIGSNAASVFAGAAWFQGGSATVENTTVAGNIAANGIGGIVASNLGATAGAVTVRSSTFLDNGRSGNLAPGGALWTFVQSGGGTATLSVTGTIVADSSSAAATVSPCTGVTSTGGNLEWPTNTCGFGTVADPKLRAFANNGGPTQTLALAPDSPAIDLGGVGCPAVDQRGRARPSGAACDTGAYEAQVPDTFATSTGTGAAPEVSFTSSDPTATFQCRIDTGSYAPCTSPFRPLLSDGAHTIAVRAAATGGYVDPTPATVLVVVITDNAPPTITATATSGGIAYAGGSWTNDDVVVHFACSDDRSGVATVTADISLTGDGADQSVTGTCVDRAGNTASATFADADIDKTAPAGAATSEYVFGAWTNADVTVAFACSDALSGVASTPANVVVSTEGAAQRVAGECVDAAGNTTTVQSGPISIDKSAPLLTAAAGGYDAGSWSRDDITVTFSCTDAASGVAAVSTAVTVASDIRDGSVSGSCTDLAGNSTTATFEHVNVDKTPPTIIGSASVTGWSRGPVTVSFTCGDAGSGIASCTPPVVLGVEGAGQSVVGTAVDAVGRVATTAVGPIDIDLTAPTVVWGAHPGAYAPTDMVEITCAAADALSGIATTTCTDVSAPASSFGPGLHTLTATVTDRAGNVTTVETTFTVRYDIASLCAVTQRLVTNKGLANALCNHLRNAENGNAKVRAAQLAVYLSQLQAAVKAKALTAANAALLAELVRGL